MAKKLLDTTKWSAGLKFYKPNIQLSDTSGEISGGSNLLRFLTKEIEDFEEGKMTGHIVYMTEEEYKKFEQDTNYKIIKEDK